MSLTKKHFVDLAKRLGEENASDRLISGIADFCEEHNPRFDRTRFIQAVEENRDVNRCTKCNEVIPDLGQALTQFCATCATENEDFDESPCIRCMAENERECTCGDYLAIDNDPLF